MPAGAAPVAVPSLVLTGELDGRAPAGGGGRAARPVHRGDVRDGARDRARRRARRRPRVREHPRAGVDRRPAHGGDGVPAADRAGARAGVVPPPGRATRDPRRSGARRTARPCSTGASPPPPRARWSTRSCTGPAPARTRSGHCAAGRSRCAATSASRCCSRVPASRTTCRCSAVGAGIAPPVASTPTSCFLGGGVEPGALHVSWSLRDRKPAQLFGTIGRRDLRLLLEAP